MSLSPHLEHLIREATTLVAGRIAGNPSRQALEKAADEALKRVFNRAGMPKRKLERIERELRIRIAKTLAERGSVATTALLTGAPMQEPEVASRAYRMIGEDLTRSVVRADSQHARPKSAEVTPALLSLASATVEVNKIDRESAEFEAGVVARKRSQMKAFAEQLEDTPQGAELKSRLAGWKFEIPIPGDSGVIGTKPPKLEELRAIAALEEPVIAWGGRAPDAEHICALVEVIAEKRGLDKAVLAGVFLALLEVAPEKRVEAIEKARAQLAEHDAQSHASPELEELAAKAIGLLTWSCDSTVVVSGFPGSPHEGFSAYKTSLPREQLGKTLLLLTEAWDQGKRRAVFKDEWEKLPGEAELNAALVLVRDALPEGVGVALLAGSGRAVQYAATIDRGDMKPLLRSLAADIAPSPKVTERTLAAGAAQALRDWHCPAGAVRTASHREVFAMNVAHTWGLLQWDDELSKERSADWANAVMGVGHDNPRFGELLAKIVTGFFGAIENQRDDLSRFLSMWRANAFARLELGHKLAAALALTDVPSDVEVLAPWPAWSLVVPDGLFPPDERSGKTLSRIWIVGTTPVFGISAEGGTFVYEANDPPEPVEAMILNLIRGACLALSDPDEFKKDERSGASSSAGKKSGRHGPPELDQARYMLSAPVKIDLREHVASVASGRKGASPTVQFLVRGHWKMQPYGPRSTLRKKIWRKPFWKGDPEARVLLRAHSVEGDHSGDNQEA